MERQQTSKITNNKFMIPIIVIALLLVAGAIFYLYGLPKINEKKLEQAKLCTWDSDCEILDFTCCPPPDPCGVKNPEIINKQYKVEVEQYLKSKCESPCPAYSPMVCSECLKMEDITPVCLNNQCTAKREINCENYCQAIKKDKSEICPLISDESLITEENNEKCKCATDETVDWKIYKNIQYGYQINYPKTWSYKEEVPQPQNFGIKVSFSDSENKHILTIQNPIPETGYEAWEVEKTEKIKIQNSEKYFTKKILESTQEDLNNLILVTWNEDNWQNSGQITLGYKENTDPNIKILGQMLSSFKFIQQKSTGFIEGSLSNPSEFIPENMVICAENTATKKLYCTEEHLKDKKYTYGIGYKIEVPAGDYFIYAYLPEDKDYKAYYSEFVTCGFEVSCPSHEPIKVTVEINQTESNIDPQDWYNY